MTHIGLFMASMDSTGVAIWILGSLATFLLIALVMVALLGGRRI